MLLLLLAVLMLGGCQTAEVAELQVTAPKWSVFTHVEGGAGYAQSCLERPPTSISQPDNEFEISTTHGWLKIIRNDGRVHVYGNESQVWESDLSWDVRRMLLTDLDSDAEQELALILWKPCLLEPSVIYNHFGFTPPCEEGTLRNHLFLYGWRDGEWRALWCSSPLADPIRELAVGDVDGDGDNEIVVLEGSYGDAVDEPARHVSVWRWNGWGFTLQWRGVSGTYCGLALRDLTGDDAPEILVHHEC
jgi:hypothetical protein